MKIEIELFGGLRDLSPNGRVFIDHPGLGALQVQALRLQVKKLFPNHMNLIESSALANEERVLLLEECLDGESHRLALLPPVNGG